HTDRAMTANSSLNDVCCFTSYGLSTTAWLMIKLINTMARFRFILINTMARFRFILINTMVILVMEHTDTHTHTHKLTHNNTYCSLSAVQITDWFSDYNTLNTACKYTLPGIRHFLTVTRTV